MMLPGEYQNGGRWSGLGRLYFEAKERGILLHRRIGERKKSKMTSQFGH